MTKQVRMLLLGAVAVAFVAGSAVAVRAEENGSKSGDKSHKTTGDHSAKLPKGFEALDLTDAQKTQIADIQKQAKDSIKAAGKDEAAIKTIKEDTKAKLLAVLTDEQKAKLAAAEAAAATQKSPKEGKNHKGIDAPKTDAPKTE